MMARLRGPLLLLGVAALLAAASWLAGFGTALYVAPPPTAAPHGVRPPPNFALFSEVWRIVNREFYGQRPPPRQITYHAVEGLVEALEDPYAAFLMEDQASPRLTSLEPELVRGIGVWIRPLSRGALVVAVVPDTPAQQVDLQPADLLLAAGGNALANRDHAGLLKLLAGPAGSSVTLVVQRGHGAPFSVKVERADFELPPVQVERPQPDVAYLRLAYFADDVVARLDQALAQLADPPPASLILDLRNNPGGSLDRVLAVAGRFVAGPLYVELQDESRIPHSVEQPALRRFQLPSRLLVLVNGGTTGTAEMLAGALRDQAGAHLVGESTFGKGTIQAVQPLSEGSLLRLTVAEWRTPAGVAVNEVGLQPDLPVELTAEDRQQGRDPQLEAALREAVTPSTASSG